MAEARRQYVRHQPPPPAAPVGFHWDVQPSLAALGWERIGDVLRAELREKLATTPAWKRCRVAFVVREDGVEVIERHELAQHYRRHGLRDLAQRVRQASLGLALVVLEGEPETAILGVDVVAWLAAEVSP
jgi:hypothetical protein